MTPAEIVGAIQAGDPAGGTELYRVCKFVGRWEIKNSGYHRSPDWLHDLWIAAYESIVARRLSAAEALTTYIAEIGRRISSTEISSRTRHKRSSEENAGPMYSMVCEFELNELHPDHAGRMGKDQIVNRAMETLSDHNREIVTRFYLEEQDKDQIQAEMDLTETQFRLHKSRALAQLSVAGKSILRPVGMAHVRVRRVRRVQRPRVFRRKRLHA